ncbi:putative secreted RxLR effector protein [Phytophthora cinnamomi]|uniref:putative secreted RxLR effector protein n=1 Tax=Phytophthora cinnamomi TaxID=4785 RepID=UPI002A2C6424|nr:putative secreted RxLR effector protein [Phytophthora cinnamomi]KAJ8530440.1 hypothetical protein ON010_g14472 [Phytophthora cinnamomi]
MRAFLLLVAIATLLVVVTVADQPELVSRNTVSNHDQRFLRSHNTNSVKGDGDSTGSEERGAEDAVKALAKQLRVKLVPKLKALADKELKAELLYLSGASHAQLYKNKVDPSVIYKRLHIHKLVESLSKADLEVNPVYKKWAGYFNYWVNRNTGKIAGRK